MSNKQNSFGFGWNIHDFDPDARETNSVPYAEWYERSRAVPQEQVDTDSLVSEILASIKAITQSVREQREMIQPQARGGTPTSARQQQKGTVPPLKVENVSFEKRVARILDVREVEGRFGKQCAVKLSYAAATYIWYLNLDTGWLAQLCEMFTQDETKWPGEEFLLYLENDSFNNRNSIHIAPVEKSSKAKR